AIRNSGTLMLGLVDDMLDFAKIEAGRFDLTPQPTSIVEVLEEVAELFFSRTNAKGLDIATYVDPSLPESALVDPARLRQVLINLVGNAVKFTEAGGIEISAGRTPSENSIRFAVSDTGPGVQPELADRIFDDFERAGADRGMPIAGSGLGLGIARKIVRAMGSDIELADQPGGGSTFAFALPLPDADVPQSERFDLSGARALLVAPSDPTRKLAARILIDHGAGVQQVDSPSRAAALAGAAAAAGEDFDFVLFDQRSANEPGSALATIRDAAGNPIEAAILIAPGSRLTVAGYQSDGFDAYLVRPLRRASLLRIADRLATGDENFGIDPHDEPQAPVQRTTTESARRVLLAEDDDVNALLLRSMLMRQGHDVTSVADGQAALTAADLEHFDVMLIDISLPKLDGLAVAADVRRREARHGGTRCLLIAVTADGRPEARHRSLAAGFDRHVVKPLTPQALSDLIEATGAAAA
ncbi:MAG: ATP-binding protein, partial [Alphaproteobacteria bacterium]